MGRSESMSMVRSVGAGRYIDHVWPDPYQVVTTASLVTFSRNRLMNQQVGAATGGFGGGGATVNLAQSATFGCVVATLAAGVADGVGQLVRINTATGPGIMQLQAKGNIPSGDYLDMGAGRVYASYAYNAFGGGAAVADSGLELTTGGGLIQSQSTAGVGFCRSATGVIIARCQTVGGGASSNVAVTGAGTAFVGFNDAILNTYEIQTTSATPSIESTISWLINGIVVRRLSHGVGTVLPVLTGGVNAMWTALIPNVAANVNVSVYQFRIIQAPTIADCF